MALVADVSIVASWFMPDEQAVGLALATAQRITVPALFWFEFRNTLLISERRGRIAEAQSRTILADLDALGLAVDREPQEGRLMALARKHRLSAYDAAYLELAERAGAELATLDRRLAAAATDEGVGLAGRA